DVGEPDTVRAIGEPGLTPRLGVAPHKHEARRKRRCRHCVAHSWLQARGQRNLRSSGHRAIGAVETELSGRPGSPRSKPDLGADAHEACRIRRFWTQYDVCELPGSSHSPVGAPRLTVLLAVRLVTALEHQRTVGQNLV